MEKFINFVKKPLVIISGALFGVFLIMLIVICAIPHGKTYSAETTITQNQMQGNIRISVELSDKVTLKMEYLSGDLFEGMDDEYRVITTSGEYKIENGELFIKLDGNSDFQNVGKINSFKITQNEESSVLGSEGSSILECTTNQALLVVSVVFMIISALVLAGSVTVLVLDKKGILKTETANAKAKIESEEPAKENENASETKTTEVVEEKTEEKTEKE